MSILALNHSTNRSYCTTPAHLAFFTMYSSVDFMLTHLWVTLVVQHISSKLVQVQYKALLVCWTPAPHASAVADISSLSVCRKTRYSLCLSVWTHVMLIRHTQLGFSYSTVKNRVLDAIFLLNCLGQGSRNSVLEGRCPTEFSFNARAWKFLVCLRPWLAGSGV